MKRLLLLALTAGLLSPIAANAESEFTELPEPSPYSYKNGTVKRFEHEGRRYITFQGSTIANNIIFKKGK